MEVNVSHVIRGNILEIAFKDANCDAMNTPALKKEILKLIDQTGCSKIVFDLSGLQFIDSSGLGLFLSIQRALYDHGGKLKIACLNKPIQTVFEIVSMHRIFEIYPTVHDAVKSF